MTERIHRPWGWYESLLIEAGYQVKRLCVEPKQALSLQSHEHRDEYWTVVQGKGLVTLGIERYLLENTEISEGSTVFIPKKRIHRATNTGSSPLVIIEVQRGGYLGEDDIKRYEDRYGRSS